jgi:hypothetical protein
MPGKGTTSSDSDIRQPHFMVMLWLRLTSLLVAVLLLGGLPAIGQDRTFDPRSLGIDLPPGIVRPGENVAVTTTDLAGQPVVGRLHVRVGDGAIVLLPDGELVPRRAGEFEPTDRPFQPLARDEMAARLKAEFPDFKIKRTNHYIYAYATSDEFAEATSRILESMLPGVKGFMENQKLAVHEPPVPLAVVMFKTEDDFRRHRRLPEGVVAYYHTLSNRVFLYEQSRLAQVRPDLAIQQAISTIAHEGAHQILHNIGVQQRLSIWPMWLSEGLAEFFAPTTTGARLKWKTPVGQVNDMRMFELEQYVKSKAATGADGQMIEHTVIAGQLTSTGYATAWALTHFLAKTRPREFAAILREASQLGPLEGNFGGSGGIVRGNQELFARHCGDEFQALETKLLAHLKRQTYLDPFKDLPHYVATLATTDGRRAQKSANTFHSPQLAAKWLAETRQQLPEEQRGSAQIAIREFPNRLRAEVFARQWRGR